MVSHIQSKEEEKEVLTALREGKSALQKLHEDNTVEDVLALMDEVNEQNEIERQVNDVLNQTGEELSDVEDAELEQELMALMGGADSTAAPVTDGGVGESIELPAVPTEKLPEVEVEPQKVPVKKVAVAS